MTQTQTVSRKAKITILSLVELYIIFSGALEYIVSRTSDAIDKPAFYPIVLAIGTFFSVYLLIMAWFWKRLLRFLSTRAKGNSSVINSEKFSLGTTYMLFITPTMIAKTLTHLGLPISQFSYFLGATILGSLVWGINDLRSSTADILGDNKE